MLSSYDWMESCLPAEFVTVALRRLLAGSLQHLDAALRGGSPTALADVLILPTALQGRTEPEQTEFLRKALADEISPEGLAVLQRDGAFGALTNLFPNEGVAWANQAGVNLGDCMAFKLERNGVRAEVVLARDATASDPSKSFRVVRCNNVKQMATLQ